MKRIVLKHRPKIDHPAGLVVIFKTDRASETCFATADIRRGEREYEWPNDGRRVIGILPQYLIR
jgi:hypothetical protein